MSVLGQGSASAGVFVPVDDACESKWERDERAGVRF